MKTPPRFSSYFIIAVVVCAGWLGWGAAIVLTERPQTNSDLTPAAATDGYKAKVALFMSDSSRKGQFGDAFGALNALFGALGFVGLLYTLALQRYEMTQQEEKDRETAGQLKIQNDAIHNQLKTMQASYDLQRKAEEALSRPHFSFPNPSYTPNCLGVTIRNLGSIVFEVSVKCLSEDRSADFTPVRHFEPESTRHLTLFGFANGSPEGIEFQIEYTTRLGQNCYERFRVNKQNQVEQV